MSECLFGGHMNYRECTIFTGATFLVPETVARIDKQESETYGATHGWQLRYGETTTFFGDSSSDGSGAAASLAAATKELMQRIHAIDAPTGLRKQNWRFKKSDTPTGISGPLSRPARKGSKILQYEYGVSIPRFGQKSTTKSVYIGTENTMTSEKAEIALAKAIEIRNKAVQAYQEAKNEAMRAANPLTSGS